MNTVGQISVHFNRFEATERRTLQEIDRERTAAAKLQKELAQIRQRHQDAEERHRTEVARIQTDLGEAHQKWGVAEGMLHELRTLCQQQAVDLIFLRTTVAEGDARKSLLERELAACRENVARLDSFLREAQTGGAPEGESAKPRKRSRKAVA